MTCESGNIEEPTILMTCESGNAELTVLLSRESGNTERTTVVMTHESGKPEKPKVGFWLGELVRPGKLQPRVSGAKKNPWFICTSSFPVLTNCY